MSKLQSANRRIGDTTDLMVNLDKWLNPPDHADVQEVTTAIGKLKSDIVLLKRKIKKAEDEITDSVEKPRSNDAKKLKNAASSTLHDELAELESLLTKIESRYEFYQYCLKMYQNALYHFRMAMKIDVG